MDAPPVNRLLQLLRQKPSETSEPSHASQSHVSLGVSTPQSIPQSNILPATESDIPKITKVTYSLLLKVTHSAQRTSVPKVADSLPKVTHSLLLKVTHSLPGKATDSLSLKVADSLPKVTHSLLLKVTHRQYRK